MNSLVDRRREVREQRLAFYVSRLGRQRHNPPVSIPSPAHDHGQQDDASERSTADDWRVGFVEINTRALRKSLSRQTRFSLNG